MDTFLKELELSGYRVTRSEVGLGGATITISGVGNGTLIYWTDCGGGFHSLIYHSPKLGEQVEHRFGLEGAMDHIGKLIRGEDHGCD